MKLLFLANRTPYPPFRGDKLKIYHLAKRLAAKGHELHLLTFAQGAEDFAALPELQKIFAEVTLVPLPAWKSAANCLAAAWDRRPVQVLYFQDSAMRAALEKVLRAHRFDAVHVQHLRMAPYLAGVKDIPRILDLPDAFSLYWKRRSDVPRGPLTKAFETAEGARVLRFEAIIKDYNLALACSAEDVAYLEKTHDAANLRLLPNGVDLDTFYPRAHDYAESGPLLFTGNMDYAPNVDAVRYFVKDIWPLIRAAQPQARFVIAGQRPVEAVRALAGEGIEVTGFVENLADMYNAASVVVAPLRFGAGTQNKVLEGLAMGIPVVCSHIGYAGLGAERGEGVFMESIAEGFAATVIALLDDEGLRRTTGERGARLMRNSFGWDAVAARLEGYFGEIAG